MPKNKMPRDKKIQFILANRSYYQGTAKFDNLEELSDEQLHKEYLKVQGSVRRALANLKDKNEGNPNFNFGKMNGDEVANWLMTMEEINNGLMSLDTEKASTATIQQLLVFIKQWQQHFTDVLRQKLEVIDEQAEELNKQAEELKTKRQSLDEFLKTHGG